MPRGEISPSSFPAISCFLFPVCLLISPWCIDLHCFARKESLLSFYSLPYCPWHAFFRMPHGEENGRKTQTHKKARMQAREYKVIMISLAPGMHGTVFSLGTFTLWHPGWCNREEARQIRSWIFVVPWWIMIDQKHLGESGMWNTEQLDSHSGSSALSQIVPEVGKKGRVVKKWNN